MRDWIIYLNDVEKAIGEVAGIESEIINIYIYPEYFSEISYGSLLVINSVNIKPIGIIVKLAHSSKYPTFTPMRMSRDEINRAYPDLDLYHLFVSSIIYTSHIDQKGEIKHYRSSSPRLHDLVYLLNNDLLEAFFKPSGDWDFSFLGYFFHSGGDIFVFRDFLYRYRDFFLKRSSEKERIIDSIVKAVRKYRIEIIGDVLTQLSDVLGW